MVLYKFNKKVDILCAFGLSTSLYAQARAWLDKDLKRRIFFVEERSDLEGDSASLRQSPRVKIFPLETPLLIEQIAKKIAWAAVFRKIEILDCSGSSSFTLFKEAVESIHLAAELLLSDAADWGSLAARHAKQNMAKPFRSALSLKGVFSKIPAIIVGAGPSLEKNGHLLSELKDSALILAGGNAVSLLSFPPHFAAGIDPKKAFPSMPFPKAPFCFQARMHTDHFSKATGEALLVPDSHFSFLNWLSEEKEALFDGGWTVGNLLTALAVHWGCDPIVFVGMDYCYRGTQKYARGVSGKGKDLVQARNANGENVWTQRDWLMAIRWTEEMAKKHPDRRWINATEGGMGFASPIETRTIQEIEWKQIPDLQNRVTSAIEKISLRQCPQRWSEWEVSLKRCASQSNLDDLKEEIAYQELLAPLWHIWRPVFERELDLDVHPIAFDEKLRLHEMLFFQQVIQEHLDVIE